MPVCMCHMCIGTCLGPCIYACSQPHIFARTHARHMNHARACVTFSIYMLLTHILTRTWDGSRHTYIYTHSRTYAHLQDTHIHMPVTNDSFLVGIIVSIMNVCMYVCMYVYIYIYIYICIYIYIYHVYIYIYMYILSHKPYVESVVCDAQVISADSSRKTVAVCRHAWSRVAFLETQVREYDVRTGLIQGEPSRNPIHLRPGEAESAPKSEHWL
jgi:hypothetical protein